jgi:ribosomal protein S18 acetylase RimI-like enzyme
MVQSYKYRQAAKDDLPFICNFPRDENELYFMFPKASFPLSTEQLQSSIDSRTDSTVIYSGETILGFANFYESVEDSYCSIGNVIVNPDCRGKGVGLYLIGIMEMKAKEKYRAKEIHISCFNQNVTGLLLYRKLGYVPYEVEKRYDKKSTPVALIKLKKEL